MFLPRVLRSFLSRTCSPFARLAVPGLSSCFDPSYYLERYPDVAHSGLDPIVHFLVYGGRESRQPNPWFDPLYYRAANPDVARSGVNPLLHFLRYGWRKAAAPIPSSTHPFI